MCMDVDQLAVGLSVIQELYVNIAIRNQIACGGCAALVLMLYGLEQRHCIKVRLFHVGAYIVPSQLLLEVWE